MKASPSHIRMKMLQGIRQLSVFPIFVKCISKHFLGINPFDTIRRIKQELEAHFLELLVFPELDMIQVYLLGRWIMVPFDTFSFVSVIYIFGIERKKRGTYGLKFCIIFFPSNF